MSSIDSDRYYDHFSLFTPVYLDLTLNFSDHRTLRINKVRDPIDRGETAPQPKTTIGGREMSLNSGRKRVIAAILGLAMVIGMAGVATADTVEVGPSQRIVDAYAAYGVEADTLMKPSAELNTYERAVLDALYGDDDARGRVNGIVLQELWKAISDDETIATITLAGRVFRTGTPEAFE